MSWDVPDLALRNALVELGDLSLLFPANQLAKGPANEQRRLCHFLAILIEVALEVASCDVLSSFFALKRLEGHLQYVGAKKARL